MNSKISVVICTKNESKRIIDCINSIVACNVGEILIVDGLSTDNTCDLVSNYKGFNNIRLLSDEGKGLIYASYLGFLNSTLDFVLFVGPDNIIFKNDLLSLLNIICTDNSIAGIGFSTKQLESDNYLAKANNVYLKSKLKPGYVSVLGTPFMYKKEILSTIDFGGNKFKFLGDSYIGEQIIAKGYKLYRSENYCYQVGYTSWRLLAKKFIMYGISDIEFYKEYKSNWTLKRKLNSILHPIISDGRNIFIDLKFRDKIYLLPFLLFIIYYRYKGWMK